MDPHSTFVAQWQSVAEAKTLGAPSIHVWRLSLGADPNPEGLESRLRLLSSDERERAERFRFDKDRTSFVLCRSALRIILGRYLDRAPEDLTFAYGANGKPSLRRSAEEASTTPLHFNVSHSGEFALIAVTKAKGIGIDIERLRRMDEMDALAKRFFSASEHRSYSALPQDARLSGFFNCWTRKEAFIKALGGGLSHPLDQFDVTLDGSEPKLLRIEGRPGEETRWAVYAFEAAPGYTAAMMIERKPNQLGFFEFGT